jgi:thiol:disulfide interchange protein
MCGGWVNITSKKTKKLTVRLAALLLLIVTAPMLLSPPADGVPWQSYDRQMVSSSLEEGNAVLLKFTAKWCTNCHKLDRTVYADPDVVKMLEDKGIVTVEADITSHKYQATGDLKTIYNEPGSVPVSILITPDGNRQKLRGVFEKKDLIELINNIVTAPMLLSPPADGVQWQSYDRQMVSSSLEEGNAVLLKFTAKWCTNCHYLDRTVYADPDVVKMLEDKEIVTVEADTTSHKYQATGDLKTIYNEPGSVPVSILITPDDTRHKLRGVFEKKDLIELIENIEQ